MNLLITKEDMPYAVSRNTDSKKIQECIMNAQLFDIKPLLPEDFYNDMVAKSIIEGSDEQVVLYRKLLSGDSYGSPARDFQGLKKALSYYAYARLLRTGDIFSTPSGNAMKNGGIYSDRPSSRAIEVAAEQAQSTAYAFWLEAEKYIRYFAKYFPYYTYNSCCAPKPKRRPGGIIFSGVGESYSRRCEIDRSGSYVPTEKAVVKFGYAPEGEVPALGSSIEVNKLSSDFAIDFGTAAIGMILSFSEPVSEPVKNVYFCTAHNMGAIPDQVWGAPIISGGERIYTTIRGFQMESINTKINFSNNGL